MDILDKISPPTIGADMIGVSIDPVSEPLTAGRVITLNFDYSKTFPSYVVKPLKLIVQPAFGDGSGFIEVLFDLFVPNSYAFQVDSAGQYLAVIQEVGHNQWQGRILLDVEGDPFQDIREDR